ncbi:MAG: phosphomevalonate kinase [Vicingaceae bacterium]|jgi:phosphomevalonate kinase
MAVEKNVDEKVDIKSVEVKTDYTMLKGVNKGSTKTGKAKKVIKKGSTVSLTEAQAKLYKKLNWI